MGIDGAHTRCSSIISCLSAFDGLLLPTLFPFAWRSTVSRRSLVLGFFVPGGYIPTLETKQRECWKFKTRGVNSEFDSRVSVRPSKTLGTLTRQTRERNTREVHSFQALIINFGSLREYVNGFELPRLKEANIRDVVDE